jgi:hypothetical protein
MPFSTAAEGKILLKTEGSVVTLVSWPSASGSVVLPESVSVIGPYAFYDCKDISGITFPAGLQTIGNYAFYNCVSLAAIDIPVGTSGIGNYTFQNCLSLVSVTVRAETPFTLGSTAIFTGTPASLRFYVPAGKVDAYKGANGWIAYADRIFAIEE